MKFKVTTEKTEGNYAQIVIEPLVRGFGHTLGNALRRVLLSSLEGSAITSVKIEGISHQFSTIVGVSEDVIEIILNLKKIRVAVNSEKPVKLTLKASGKKEITAGDFEIEGDAQISNPEQPVLTLTDAKSKISMEAMAEKGRGYSLSDERKSNEIGLIPVDALYSPVVSVNYSVEPTRVGRSADYDKIILDITTDGTKTAEQVLEEGSRILSEAFRKIYEPDAEEEVVVDTGSSIPEDTLKMTIEELDLPVRITNALKAIEINTVSDLINVSRQTLLKAKNLGAKSITLISEKLSERGLVLREA